jgi:hypothetical protein
MRTNTPYVQFFFFSLIIVHLIDYLGIQEGEGRQMFYQGVQQRLSLLLLLLLLLFKLFVSLSLLLLLLLLLLIAAVFAVMLTCIIWMFAHFQFQGSVIGSDKKRKTGLCIFLN